MALAALRGGRIEGEGFLADSGRRSVFVLQDFCIGFSRFFEYQSVLRIRWRSLAGASDSILTKECCAHQHGARERAEKHRESEQSLHCLFPVIHTFQGGISICIAHAETALNWRAELMPDDLLICEKGP